MTQAITVFSASFMLKNLLTTPVISRCKTYLTIVKESKVGVNNVALFSSVILLLWFCINIHTGRNLGRNM